MSRAEAAGHRRASAPGVESVDHAFQAGESAGRLVLAVVREILLIGDAARRSGLIQRIRDLGYGVDACQPRDLLRCVRELAPAAVLVCTEDADAAQVMAQLRERGHEATQPVLLYGRLGREMRDLADVLDLGADHFVEEHIDDDELGSILNDLVGPSQERAAPRAKPQEQRRPGTTDVLGQQETGARAAEQIDPSIGQLHRTLDFLEARLRAREQTPSSEPAESDDVDLQRMGLEDVPNVDAEEDTDLLAGESNTQMRFSQLSNLGDDGQQEELGAQAPDSTVRLAHRQVASSSPAAPATEPEPGKRHHRPLASWPIEPEGDLAEIAVPALLWRLYRVKFTGRVTLERGRVRKELWFEHGEIVFARSNLSRDRLVDGLLRRGLLTRSQYETARRLVAKEPRRAGQLLVDAGHLKPGELHDVVRSHLVSIVESIFPWVEGRWFAHQEERCEEPVRIDTGMPRLIASGVRRAIENEQIRDLLGTDTLHPRQTQVAKGTPGGLSAFVRELEVPDAAHSWIERMDGKHSVAQIVAELDADEHEILALVYAMVVMGMLELLEEPEPEAEVDTESIDRRRILDRLALVREADYYALLGLHPDATRSDVRRAYSELMTTFSDDAFEPETRSALAAEILEIRSALEEAHVILSDDVLRAAYLAHLEKA